MVLEDFDWDDVKAKAIAARAADMTAAETAELFAAYDPETDRECAATLLEFGREIAYHACPDDEGFEAHIMATIDHYNAIPA